VVPTIHYQMGGIPTNIHGQVVVPQDGNPTRGQRPVRGGRMLLRQRARRQPPGHQLAAGPAGVRPRGRQPHRRVQQQAQDPQAAAGRRRRPHAGAPGQLDKSTSGEYAQDVANDIRATMQQHAGVFRTQASMDEGVKQDRRPARARQGHHAEGQVQGLQHRAHRGAGSREPDRVRAGHHGVGRRPQANAAAPTRCTTTSARRRRRSRWAATTRTG
jgi:succinate dehydrogenase/fumarate reductase flavoprotein subunit